MRLILIYLLVILEGIILFIYPNKNPKNDSILLVKVDALGDLIIWLNSAKKIRDYYKSKKIILVISSSNFELVKNLNYWDEIISISIKKFNRNILYRLKILNQIRYLNIKIAIQPTYSRSIMLGDSIIRWTKALNSIGYDGDNSNIHKLHKRISDNWYTKLITSNASDITEFEKNKSFINQLLNINSELELSVLDQNHKDKCIEKYCIVFPGASWQGKIWEVNKFIETIKYINNKYHLKIVLCGGYDDVGIGNNIVSAVNFNINNLIGKTSITDLTQLLPEAEFVLGNDSAGIHLAAALGVKSICVLGGGHFGRFMPYPKNVSRNAPVPVYKNMSCYNCNWNCKYNRDKGEPLKCISSIHISDVTVEIDKLYETSVG
jgi:ADP-heptose:LPS heptosyltransferase